MTKQTIVQLQRSRNWYSIKVTKQQITFFFDSHKYIGGMVVLASYKDCQKSSYGYNTPQNNRRYANTQIRSTE